MLAEQLLQIEELKQDELALERERIDRKMAEIELERNIAKQGAYETKTSQKTIYSRETSDRRNEASPHTRQVRMIDDRIIISCSESDSENFDNQPQSSHRGRSRQSLNTTHAGRNDQRETTRTNKIQQPKT